MTAIYRFAEIEWHAPTAPGTDPEATAESARKGARRGFLAQGDSGFYTQIVDIPPNFDAPHHSHDHGEVFLVLEGSCTFDGQPLRPYDMAVVEAGQVYGFTSGNDGLRFLVIRTGVASFAAVQA
jgi:quercetin dioxygenase-like cupin family protein